MSRFDSNGLYQQCYSAILERAMEAENNLARMKPLEPGEILGVTLRTSIPLIHGNTPWIIRGQFQCSGSRYIEFVVSGVDSHDRNFILSFAVEVFDASGVTQRSHSNFLGDSRNAQLVWEYESGGARPWLHIHMSGTSHRRIYPPLRQSITHLDFEGVLIDALKAAHDAVAFWEELLPEPDNLVGI